ncbi:adenylate/guanylate cyclase domain-containing protein [Marinobacterium nitratireducens]|uniref:Adenylate/guanylate cyclase domain-containing protein n=2 Tax=Marinobacterium nitratireducens TaxID=518897 RepID=A0A917ZEY5_9GAMM|nr:adenylate/guanylate cyclase domain-containing protein [Marinobacterium nitratireducens]GGO81786.1 adenylate/guanylate cyclase domain-containing protein [Marinobacterium nitratireducens]
MQGRSGGGGERKTITMLFADLANSTELIQHLDAEEAQQLIDPVLQLMMEAVHHYEGYVAKSLGDGILALFGAPIAHEDHARRALYAALRMQHRMEALAGDIERRKGLQLLLRVGIHSGEVVVRSIHTEDLHTDYDPVGRSIHIASRMESVAPPGGTVVSESSYRLTRGFFEFRALGPTRVKGVAEPIQIYELLAAGPLRTRLEVSAHRGLVPFVGRKPELERLRALLARARAGRGQLVAARGEPGVGKSRLFLEFKRSVKDDCLVLETFSVCHTRAFAYWPLIGLLKQYFDLGPEDDACSRRDKISARVAALDVSRETCLPYLLYLLGGVEEHSPLFHLDPQTRRERTFGAIEQLLLAQSRQEPLLLIFEDLQWLDSETQAFLERLADALEGHRLMLLMNYRPEYRDHWLEERGGTRLQLDPLALSDAGGLLRSLLGEAPELKPVARRILDKTEGNPFFIEEVVQALVEEQVLLGERGQYRLGGPADDLQLPMTVQGVLAARIDRLASESKALLQLLAVIGKALPFGLVRQVSGTNPDDLMLLLARLQGADFIYSVPAYPEQEFAFKHALTMEVAYRSLLSERRSELHERTARAIESLYRERLDEHYGELAHHYSRSGDTAKAIEYLQLAGRQAVQRYANSEAITQLSKAIELIGSLPESSERDRLELAARLTLGPALMASRGYAAPEVESTYSGALQLCRQVGANLQLFPALLGLRTFYHVRGQLPVARELSEQLVRLASEADDSERQLEAHRALGTVLFSLGELDRARRELAQALAFYDCQHSQRHVFYYGVDSGVFSLFYMAWVLWYQGYPEQALAKSGEGLALAETLDYPFIRVVALVFDAETHLLRRDLRQTQERAEEAIAQAQEHGFPIWSLWGRVLRGWALAQQGEQDAGIAEIRQGLAADRAAGAELWRPYFLSLLLEVLCLAGRLDEARDCLSEAHASLDATEGHLYESELYRLEGMLLLRQGEDAAAAQACFEKAIAIARGQGARSLELRAATCLADLLREQGKSSDARQLLEPVLRDFGEGLETADLRRASTLLSGLPESG